MPRTLPRRIAQSPNLIHAAVLRDNTGAIQTTQVTSVTGSVTDDSATETPVSLTVNDPQFVAFTSASLTVSPTGTGDGTATLNQNGTGIATLSPTGGATPTTTISNTHTTPLNAPTYSLVVQAVGTETVNWTLALTREQQVG